MNLPFPDEVSQLKYDGKETRALNTEQKWRNFLGLLILQEDLLKASRYQSTQPELLEREEEEENQRLIAFVRRQHGPRTRRPAPH